MDSPSTTPGSLPGSNDENPRVKFLCSFSGSILPRPQDGKLRYVGGETRILSVPRDITYEVLIVKMRELYEGAAVLKYQQPDEDLDALVSVVNEDDVTNMMEEYDKLGSGGGFTRLRIFLFSNTDQDGGSPFVDGDERDTERRYVDALNSLNESTAIGTLDETHVVQQYFNQIGLESGLHNQRNYEIPISQFNLHHLTIPHMGSGQHQQMEPPWSPAYCSPRHPGNHDPRPPVEFPTSPSLSQHHVPFGEFSDKGLDRMSDECGRQKMNHQPPYDHQLQLSDSVAWLPNGPVPCDISGVPGNIFHGHSVFDGSVCEQCRMTFQRNQTYPDSPWKHGEQQHFEQPNMANGFHKVASPCAECVPNQETFLLNADAKFHHGFYHREQNDPRIFYNESHNHERGWILQSPSAPRADEAMSPIPVAVRLNDQYVVDGIPIASGNISEGHYLAPNYDHHEDPWFVRSGLELGNGVFRDQASASGSHIHYIPSVDEHGTRHGNLPNAYGEGNHCQVSHAPGHALWRHVHNPLPGPPSYEVSASPQQANGTVTARSIRGKLEGSPSFCIGAENQNPWVESSQIMMCFDGSALPGNSYGHALGLNPHAYTQENQYPRAEENGQSPNDVLNLTTPTEPVQLSDSALTLTNDKLISLTTSAVELRNDKHATESEVIGVKSTSGGGKEINDTAKVDTSNMQSISVPEQNKNVDNVVPSESIHSNGLEPSKDCSGIVKPHENGTRAPLEDKKLSEPLNFLPELIASVKKAALEGARDVKAKVQENANSSVVHDATAKEETADESESADMHGDVALDPENDNLNNSRIEPTKAEAEAISRGLQTIRNDDLEEIKELGSGTYGAVYHGKWKGSDVAIKRIKASCFAGRPSERERLIADFWKEALILGSLHHPNVVSFYGIVRDGPDGTLATVTEFMVNGSLKQFLQKKDRTIDRRKRLIIAMDAAFGMEYLHGKNIVHFDLKCENLLVNMRDPHRPVCKIGDLGLSKVKQHTLVSGGIRGTLPWMAPELLSGKSNMVSEKIDVYSFGIVMWELLTGDEPYADMHCASIIGGIVNNTLRPKIPTWCDPEWKSLMESCWSSDPSERPSFAEISPRLRNMAAAINVK
ncbi:Serine/threonine-protein kinase [Actinidia chinensis var. chinensis]|uniref:Serine/threonine-protein kinase n=1 Tax=Actinidia chinensis var. chinensis TaxID=1590841 RepID=A0A2R6QHU4_ACTCC|nr:Serine/threonine-protein kinase [Actinidia chinensis var. chinensis]